ncbi:Bgt-1287 [Blumeria graminis f. sp. tritici]|uniref:alpha-1,2-Mannosidase n=1 Tax=Blumeria graminis f. sp. tritici TaxID=62690 RepID=A0A9X9MQ68_BLUGR|nr:Bgt-1287 [Blumeria graminis f. sp. tritici]
MGLPRALGTRASDIQIKSNILPMLKYLLQHHTTSPRQRIFVPLIILVLATFYFLTSHPRFKLSYSPHIPLTSQPQTNKENTHWSKLPERYPVTSLIPLPTGTPQDIPSVQAPSPEETESQREERYRRKKAVMQSFSHSWDGYKKHAWLRDEVTPLSGKYKDTFCGWAATLVDSLDTLWLMGMKEDFEIAVKAALSIDFTLMQETDPNINVFETTIRYMGGFLAAYDISEGKYQGLLFKAVEVGDLLMSAFDTPNRMPVSRWPWKDYLAGKAQKAQENLIVSELGSLSLEFTRLSQLTGDAKYYDAVQRISDVLEASQNSTQLPGMWPVNVNAAQLSFDSGNFFSLGGMSDSLYEYLPKQYILLGGLISQPKKLYENFIEVAKEYLFVRIFNEHNANLSISGDVRVSQASLTMDARNQHLTCFVGGMVGLAAKVLSRPSDLIVAEELTQGCIWAYDVSPNGVAPEIFSLSPCLHNYSCDWDDTVYEEAINKHYGTGGAESAKERKDQALKTIHDLRLPRGFIATLDHRYVLRPEAIESVFILYRITGKTLYADAAWRMFQAVEKISQTPIAAAALRNVMVDPDTIDDEKIDSMESFWLAETLKYFYLCFEDWNVLSLDEWVFNTEAHPFQRPKNRNSMQNVAKPDAITIRRNFGMIEKKSENYELQLS